MAVSRRFRDLLNAAGARRVRMNEKVCRPRSSRSATGAKTFEPTSAIHERAGNPPTWALETHQNASAYEPRWRSPGADCQPATGPCTTQATLMTVKDAATLLRVSTKTIRRLIEREELRVIRIGRSLRLRSVEITEYLSRSMK